MTDIPEPLTVRPKDGFTPSGYRVVNFILREDVFNRSKAKAMVLSVSFADYVGGLMEKDSNALAQLTQEGEQHASA